MAGERKGSAKGRERAARSEPSGHQGRPTVPEAARRAQAAKVIAGLKKAYPKADCALVFTSPLELLVATILSAQCTDVRVNIVTKALFRRCRSAADYAAIPQAELESIIRSTGFFRNKAASLRGAAKLLVETHGGKVPRTMGELLELPGVARKTANVVLGTAFQTASGVVVDTHVRRLSYRMGLTDHGDPVKVEADLMGAVPQREWVWFGHAMIWHGRRVCVARAPRCPECVLNRVCPKRGV